MPKPDPSLLDPARYPFSYPIAPRYGDLDPNGHINNVAITGFLEDARVRFYAVNGYREATDGLATMIVSLAIEYLGEGHHPDTLTVHTALDTLGRTSHTVAQMIVQGETTVAFARTVVVAVGEGRAAALPEAFADQARPWMLRP